MKRFISLFFAVLIAFCCTVSSAAEEETLPIPERPENFYIIDESGLLDKRTIDALQKKSDALFAVTGAQVVFIVVAEDDKTDLGELAQQTLEVWELGSYERDNGIVVTMNFNRGRVSYAVGDGITDLYNTATMQELITSHHVGDYFAKGQYDRAVLAMYNEIYLTIQEYYEIDVSFWDNTTYVYEAKYEHEVDYKPVIYGAAGVLFVVIALIIVACTVAKKKKLDSEADEVFEDEAGFSVETENMGDIEEETEKEEYNTDEGEYNTHVGEYNTSDDEESYCTLSDSDETDNGEWKYN